jgi:hypothetical protein
MDADYECVRCGEVVSWVPTCKPWAFGWIHSDPNDCVRYTALKVRKETEERVRKEFEEKAKVSS